ncbi:hypothetical protein N665_4145s0001 [Sinapis alba]|nr:hypothetical protein N665_4145s0001 [Sinapis alba]
MCPQQVCASWPFPSRNRVTTEKEIDSSSIFFTRQKQTVSSTVVPFLVGELDTRASMSVKKDGIPATVVALVAVIVSVVASVASAQVEAPAPSPTSGSGSFSPSIVSAGVAAAAALVFGSALRI